MSTVLQASATPNNQLLVWDRFAANWIGTWEGDALRASHFFTWLDGETERAGVIGPDGMVYQLMVDECTDDAGTHEGMVLEAAVDMGDQAIPAQVAELTVEHEYGAWATFIEADGPGETSGPFQVVPDATQYTTWATPAYDLTNVNDDQKAPHREDYAILMDETDGVYMSSARGWALSLGQVWTQKVRATRALRSMLFRIETMRGWVAVKRCAARVRRAAFSRGRKT